MKVLWITLAGCVVAACCLMRFTRHDASVVVAPRPPDPHAFRIPTRAQQVAAVGELSALSLVEQRAFAVTDEFTTIRKPDIIDWLGKHREVPQTFHDFVNSPRNPPSASADVIYILPLGSFPEGHGPVLADLREYAESFFGLEVKILPSAPLAEDQVITRRTREGGEMQYLTTAIHSRLMQHLPDDAFCLIGVTMEDLYPDPSWNYVFGQATYADRVGVFSFKRYTPEFNGEPSNDRTRRLMLRRSCDVLVHETGHMFGLTHCTFFECAMCGSNHLKESDSRPMHACPVCLRKLHTSVRFDLVTRYQRLLAFYKKHGFTDEAQWAGQRLARLTAP